MDGPHKLVAQMQVDVLHLMDIYSVLIMLYQLYEPTKKQLG
jgi:hypothetical protein